MPKVALYNMNGEQVGDIQLSEAVFGVEVNEHVVHQVVKAQLANKRQGTQSAKTRAEVRGGGAKPWRQKGTGRARQGSIRAPQWVGGGVVFAPKPRDYSIKLSKKERRLALKSVLTSKVQDNNVIVLDELKFDAIKTKQMVSVLNALKAEKALVVIAEKDENVVKSTANIPNVQIAYPNTINTYDVLRFDKFIVTKDAAAKIEEVYA